MSIPLLLFYNFTKIALLGLTHFLGTVSNKLRRKGKISVNSTSGYYSTFRGLLKIAYRDKLIKENVNDFLDKIEPQEVKKEYLTLDELKRLVRTPYDYDVLKRASLFACLTGLRISDILNLKWQHIELVPDDGYCIRIKTQKTETEATLPISYEAYELCGEPNISPFIVSDIPTLYSSSPWEQTSTPSPKC